MIKFRKCTKQLFCGGIVGSGRFFWGSEASKMPPFTIDSDKGSPPTAVWEHPLVASLIVATQSAIANILRGITFPEVFSAIIQRVSIFVITHLFIFQAKYKTVHGNMMTIVPPVCVKMTSFRFKSRPIPLAEPFEVREINDGILILRQWDKSVRFVLRLDNWMAFYTRTLSRHLPTSNRNLCSAAL